jgi:hypothetical protein
MPIGITNIGWKMYMINGSWDIIIVVLIVSPLELIPVIFLFLSANARYLGCLLGRDKGQNVGGNRCNLRRSEAFHCARRGDCAPWQSNY